MKWLFKCTICGHHWLYYLPVDIKAVTVSVEGKYCAVFPNRSKTTISMSNIKSINQKERQVKSLVIIGYINSSDFRRIKKQHSMCRWLPQFSNSKGWFGRNTKARITITLINE